MGIKRRESWAALVLLAAPLTAATPEKLHELCAVCHKEIAEDFLTHPHFKQNMECNVCHGESVGHRNSEGHQQPDRVASASEIPGLCGPCHRGKAAKSILAEYLESTHGKLVLAQSKTRAPHCGTCHGVHRVLTAKEMESQCKRCHTQLPAACSAPRPKTTPVSCAACHSAHVFSRAAN